MLARWFNSVGAATLLFLAEWRDVDIVYGHAAAYFTAGRFPFTYVASVALAVLIMAAALTGVLTTLEFVGRLLPPTWRPRLWAAATSVGIAVLWTSATAAFLALGTRIAVAVLFTLLGIVLLVEPPSHRFPAFLSKVFHSAGLLLVISVATASVRYLMYPTHAPQDTARLEPSNRSVGRVLWLVFDELDSGLAIKRRPAHVALPAFDRLRIQSLEASSAHSPGQWTLDAMPTLWTGRPIVEARERGPAGLSLAFLGSSVVREFDPSSSVFALAHRSGGRVGIAGWYHPYCRLFGRFSGACLEELDPASNFAVRRALVSIDGGMGVSIGRLIARHMPWSLDAVVAGGFTQARLAEEEAYVRSKRSAIFERIHERTVQMAGDGDLSLVFAHYPIPHLPGLSRQLSQPNDASPDKSYENNLLLMDRSINDLRSALEQAGLWQSTAVIVHSDHALRPELWKRLGMWSPVLQQVTGGRQSALTPFLIKMPGVDENGVAYDHPFSTALTADLTIGILRGELRSSSDVVAWLDANRDRVPLEWPVKTIADR